VAPEPFQVVVAPRILGENVHHEISVIHQDPFRGIVTLDADRQLTHLLQLFLDLIANGMALPGIRNSTEDEKVSERGDLAEIEDTYVGSFLRLRCIRGRAPVGYLGGYGRGGVGNRAAC
jgi:hypothetical protein